MAHDLVKVEWAQHQCNGSNPSISAGFKESQDYTPCCWPVCLRKPIYPPDILSSLSQLSVLRHCLCSTDEIHWTLISILHQPWITNPWSRVPGDNCGAAKEWRDLQKSATMSFSIRVISTEFPSIPDTSGGLSGHSAFGCDCKGKSGMSLPG